MATPMIAPTKAYSGMPALTPQEAAEWMITAARTRPVRIAPRIALMAKALNTLGPGGSIHLCNSVTTSSTIAD
ncbi:short chain dehydrogenase domain protein [Mycobacterium ulcerans str. Harvey]|uniref:Short chain dehydrogenase domain protein n=1 Tax=Mycobacterium ulcerans str. Harvey TaxID=1299332 RepID=A0ABP3AMU8_MYCUL|nr:short chain dehydrogenase domain protein [Mycobacterium ulcerans str. Harvey]